MLENKSLKAQYHFYLFIQIIVETLSSDFDNCNKISLLNIIQTRDVVLYTFYVSCLCLFLHLLCYVTLSINLIKVS